LGHLGQPAARFLVVMEFHALSVSRLPVFAVACIFVRNAGSDPKPNESRGGLSRAEP